MSIPPLVFKGAGSHDNRRRHRLIKPGSDGRLYAINPEAGYFGVAPHFGEV